MQTVKIWRDRVRSWKHVFDLTCSALRKKRLAHADSRGELACHDHIHAALAKTSVGVMAHRLGVDPLRLAANEWLHDDIVRNCAACSGRATCRAWLADPDGDPEDYREFCPNAKRFEDLRKAP